VARGESVLDLRGMGGFIPYWSIEDLVKKTGEAVISVDDAVERLIEIWARRRGYTVERLGRALLRIRAGGGVVEALKPREEVLSVSEKEWDSELSQKLSDISRIVEVVLKAPILYRGRVNKEEIARIVKRPGTLLIRFHVGAVDYFFVAKGSAIIAAAKLGAPLSPAQARSILETVLKDKDVSVTIYDVSTVTI